MKLRLGWILLRNSFIEWLEDKAPRLGAALAYYTAFSLSPLLVIVIAIAGLVFGQEAAEGQIIAQMQGLVGHDGAQAIAAMVQNARKPSSGIIATVVGLATLLIGATGVFGELRDALNTIWEVQPRAGRGLTGLIKDRFLSFTMVVGVGFLLLVSLSVSAGLAAMGRFLGSMLPGLVILSQIINFVVSFSVIGMLFALIYRYLPDLKIPWHDVWIGAALNAGLFEIGKFLIGFYLGNSSISSA
jgi:membrane protein